MIHTMGSGARQLLDYLQALEQGSDVAELWERLWENPSFAAWVGAYSRGIKDMEEGVRALLREPGSDPQLEPAFFWRALAQGFAEAMQPEINARCRRSLEALLATDTRSIEAKVLAFLPPETPLEIDLHLTVDNFNGGMFRGRQVFLSVLKIPPERVTSVVEGLGHEFHHVGASYWFERHPRLQQLRRRNAAGELIAKVIEYLVSEGLANAFFSPQAIEAAPETPAAPETTTETKAHNARVHELEARWPAGLIQEIETLLSGALTTSEIEDLEQLRAAFQSLSIDSSGAGVPAGHFAAGRMIQRISGAWPRERVIALVRAPWKLFRAYNEAVDAQEPRFSTSLLTEVEQRFEL